MRPLGRPKTPDFPSTPRPKTINPKIISHNCFSFWLSSYLTKSRFCAHFSCSEVVVNVFSRVFFLHRMKWFVDFSGLKIFCVVIYFSYYFFIFDVVPSCGYLLFRKCFSFIYTQYRKPLRTHAFNVVYVLTVVVQVPNTYSTSSPHITILTLNVYDNLRPANRPKKKNLKTIEKEKPRGISECMSRHQIPRHK